MILNKFLRVNLFLFCLYNYLYAASRTGVYLATGAGKTVSTGTIAKVPLKGSPAFMAQNDPDQFIHSEDAYPVLLTITVFNNQIIVQAIVHLKYPFHFTL